MEIDVIIPGMRQIFIEKVLYSFSRNTIKPDAVTIVSNEINKNIQTYGLHVRLIRFTSASYPVGHLDTALRRNIGIWNSPCSHIITFDDDQLAPGNLIETSMRLLQRVPYFWGHYRYIDFSKYTVDELVHLSPYKGRARENPPNAWHLWLSSYGGLFGAERAFVERLGGFDLIFCGRHSGEDQQLGKRLAAVNGTQRIFVYEPPFAWHAQDRIEWSPSGYSNLCLSEHQFVDIILNGAHLQKCSICPYFEIRDGNLFSDSVIMKFAPGEVDVVEELI